jgi:alkylated DNA nucleotide flippase Atl1
MTAKEKIAQAAPAFVAKLEGAKAEKWKADTMLIPSPAMIRDAIAGIPHGITKTVVQLRQELAEANGADVTCPRATTIGWLLVAEAAEEDGSDDTPWWRLTRDGKTEPKLPGGREGQRAKLAEEGVKV